MPGRLPAGTGTGQTLGLPAAASGKTKRRETSIPPGQEEAFRAAYEAGDKRDTIARFRLSRAQLAQVVGWPKRQESRLRLAGTSMAMPYADECLHACV